MYTTHVQNIYIYISICIRFKFHRYIINTIDCQYINSAYLEDYNSMIFHVLSGYSTVWKWLIVKTVTFHVCPDHDNCIPDMFMDYLTIRVFPDNHYIYIFSPCIYIYIYIIVIIIIIIMIKNNSSNNNNNIIIILIIILIIIISIIIIWIIIIILIIII